MSAAREWAARGIRVNSVCFPLSRAAGCITGQHLSVDGSYTIGV